MVNTTVIVVGKFLVCALVLIIRKQSPDTNIAGYQICDILKNFPSIAPPSHQPTAMPCFVELLFINTL